MRILFITDGLSLGGKERQLFEIIKTLSRDYTFTIGVITFNKAGHYSASIKELVPFFVEIKKRPTRLEPFFTIWKHIKQFNPQIIHTLDSLSSMYAFLPILARKIKFIDGSIRDAGVEKGWQFKLKSFFLKRADLVVSNSLAGLKYYVCKGEVIYNAINTERFLPKENTEDCNVIMVANFTDFKDHETFFNACISLLTSGVISNVYFAGEGKHKTKYITLIEENHPQWKNKIHFLGHRSDVEVYLANCKYGVLCSTAQYGEGVSNSVLEYMAAGLVPIATNVGGMGESIVNNNNGFLINPQDSKAIVEIISFLELNDRKYKTIVENAKNTIHEKFSYKANVQQLIEIYSRLCGKF